MRRRTRAAKLIHFCESLRVPTGKLAGKPIKLLPFQKRFIRDIYEPTSPDGLRQVRRAILSIGRKNGKGLALDTPIPTPEGWRTMRDIEAGDYVYGSDGKPTLVQNVSEIHYGLSCWELSFADGSKIVADEQHQWLTQHKYRPWEVDYPKKQKNGTGYGRRAVQAVVTTPQIADSVKIPNSTGRNENNHKVFVAPELKSEPRSLPIPPYTLGLWLGDGTSTAPMITTSEEDLAIFIANINQEINHPVRTIRRLGKSPQIAIQGTRQGPRSRPCLRKDLRELGVLGNKHIPDIYFNAGTEQRWALLQGLMDSDGTVSCCAGQTTARCSFSNTNEALAVGAWRLARSLGLKATLHKRLAKLYGRTIGFKFDVAFPATIHQPIFRLPRKQQLLPYSLGKRSYSLSLVACEPVASVPTKCLQVAAADKLFLCGHGCIPTHNTTLIACLVLAHLCGPEAVLNGEIYSAANEREQAALTFKIAAQIARMTPGLQGELRIIDSTKTMAHMRSGSFYRALSAEAGSKMGLNPTFVVYDELAQAKKRDLYDALDSSMGARLESLFAIISTQSHDPEHLLSKLIDDGLRADDPTLVCHLYETPEDADVWDERTWKASNPALGHFRLLSDLRSMAAKAKRMPANEPAFRNLFLNQRVDARAPLISRAEWTACRTEDSLRLGEEIYLGLDLSATTDLCSLAAISATDGDRTALWNWKPADLLDEHEARDRVPYRAWVAEGYIDAPPGRSIDYGYVAQRIGELAGDYQVVGLAYDRWRIENLLREFNSLGIDAWIDGKDTELAGGIRLVPFGQGFRDMAPAIDALEVSVLERHLQHDGHPVLTWAISNAQAISDPAGNRKLDKSRSRFRIDPVVALVMAKGLKARDLAEGPVVSAYEGMDAAQIVERMAL